jgi:hypothetical protein
MSSSIETFLDIKTQLLALICGDYREIALGLPRSKTIFDLQIYSIEQPCTHESVPKSLHCVRPSPILRYLSRGTESVGTATLIGPLRDLGGGRSCALLAGIASACS